MLPRISVQSSVLHKQTPNFCLKNLEQGQILIWDDKKHAFTNADPNTIELNRRAIDSLKVFTVTGDGVSQAFLLPWLTSNKSSLIVTIQGVKQQSSAYSILTNNTSTQVILSEPLPVGEELEIIGLIVEDESEIKAATFTADGSTTTFTVPWIARGPESLVITIDGVKQQLSAYSIAAIGDKTRITFNGVPSSGMTIEIVGLVGGVLGSASVTSGVLPSGIEFRSISFAGDGLTSSFVLPWQATSVESLIVTLNGIKQQLSAYAIVPTGNTTVLQLAGVPFSGETLEVIGIDGTFSAPGQIEFSSLGTGMQLIDQTGTLSNIGVKSLQAGNGISLVESSGTIRISRNKKQVRTELVNTYTVTLSDEFIVMNYMSPITVYIPADSTTMFEIGHEIEIAQVAGQITVMPVPGVSVIAANNIFTTDGPGTSIRLIKINSNQWLLLK